MATFEKMLNLNDMFRNSTRPPVIVNDIIINNINDRKKLRELLLTTYSSDVYTMAPSCQCGELVATYKLGSTCRKCGTVVTKKDSDLEPMIWIRCLHPNIKFFAPHAWGMMSRFLKKKNFNLLEWLTNTRYECPIPAPTYLTVLESLPNFKRGYAYFSANFETILNIVINLKEFKTKDTEGMSAFINNNKNDFLVDYVPVPNKTLLLLENTTKGRYFNYGFSKIMDSVYTVLSSKKSMSEEGVGNRTARIMAELSEFYASYFRDFLSGKPGILRKHVFGGRANFSGRAVITSISGPHRYDEVYMPWGLGVTIFRPHIINKLTRLGWSVKAATKMFYESVNMYSETINHIFDELIEECDYVGIPILFQRNPSLLGGSAQRVFITKVKRTVSDATISMSDLIAKAFNADHDGDEVSEIR